VKLVMTLFVRNEEDVLEANIDYHLEQGVDFVIATDNGSDDGTREILERYAGEGHVRVLSETGHSYSQPEGMTRMARMAAAEHGADWIINNDADEFWWPRAGTLKEAFGVVPEDYGALSAFRVNFAARPEGDPFFADRMTVARVREVSATADRSALKYPFDRYAHFVMPKLAHRAGPDVEVIDASHALAGEHLPTLPGWHPVDILHFPLRSYEQFERKVRNGGRALESHPDPTFNRHLRELYALHRDGRLPEYWADTALDDDAVATGLAERRLIVDRRLQAFFRARPGDAAPSPVPTAEKWPEPDAIEANMLREASVGEWYESRAAGLERRLATREEQVRRLEGRLEKAEAARRALAERQSALHGSRWGRLGSWGRSAAKGARRLVRPDHGTTASTSDRRRP